MKIPYLKVALIGWMPSFLKIFVYRLFGAKIGKNVKIGFLSVINCPNIIIEEGTTIGLLSIISTKKSLKLSSFSKIGSLVFIETNVLKLGRSSQIMDQVIVGGIPSERSSLKIGERVKIFPFSFLNPTEPIIIEDDVGVGGGSYIFSHGSWQNTLDGFTATFAPVTIKRNAWLPWRSFVTSGVTIGEDAIISPGTVVSKNIPDGGALVSNHSEVIDLNYRHKRNFSPEQKYKLLKKYLRNFFDSETSDYGEVSYKSQQEFENLYLLNNHKICAVLEFNLDAIFDADTVISIKKIPPQFREKLNKKNICWIDIESKERSAIEATIFIKLIDFISRYGIRFSKCSK